ncbi:hypothetical protein BGI42_06535 [Clostridium taeniosporum]|uniref:Carboxypeptidase regulatory-like domain-containing protein n=1 Tax=Clostridium taeniosporum TaxID=394958 RepID=A0A1D7XJ99_9CLOT|nr:hypothetical protein BGI42_06535 [Clostridium taeniosporum]
MSWHKEILISPKELKGCCVLNKKIIIKKTMEVLITGKIVNQYGDPLSKAVVYITQVDNSYYSPGIKEYGYLITNEQGEYAMVVPCNSNLDYVLEVYEPIVRC